MGTLGTIIYLSVQLLALADDSSEVEERYEGQLSCSLLGSAEYWS